MLPGFPIPLGGGGARNYLLVGDLTYQGTPYGGYIRAGGTFAQSGRTPAGMLTYPGVIDAISRAAGASAILVYVYGNNPGSKLAVAGFAPRSPSSVTEFGNGLWEYGFAASDVPVWSVGQSVLFNFTV